MRINEGGDFRCTLEAKRHAKPRRLTADGRHPDHTGTRTPATPGEAECARLESFRLQPDGRVTRDHTHVLALWRAGGFRPAQIIHVSRVPLGEDSLRIHGRVVSTVLQKDPC